MWSNRIHTLFEYSKFGFNKYIKLERRDSGIHHNPSSSMEQSGRPSTTIVKVGILSKQGKLCYARHVTYPEDMFSHLVHWNKTRHLIMGEVFRQKAN